MPQVGVWTTANGTSEARLELGSDDGGITATELPSWASGALQGAIAGATTGAAAGPYGALIGAAAGGALGASSSAATPAPAASVPADASRARIIQALQQFAAIVPALIQLVSASGQGRKESSVVGDSRESAAGSDWGPESFEGTWTVP
jgi:hypothetical protein